MKRLHSKHLPWQLAIRYLLKHKMQFAAIALVMGLFASTLFSVQLLRGCVQHTLLQMRLDTYGHFSGASLWVDPDTVTAEKLEKGHGGLVQVYGEFLIEEQNTQISYGTLDASAAHALKLQFKDGTLPQQAGEIALPYTVYVQLKQFVNIGESITLPIADAQGNAHATYTLCGVFYDGYDQWEQAYSLLENTTLPDVIMYPTGETPSLAHIIFDDSYIGKMETTPDALYWCDGKYYVNWCSVHRTTSTEEEENNNIVLLTTLATILLSVLVFFGIRNAACMMLHEQQKKSTAASLYWYDAQAGDTNSDDTRAVACTGSYDHQCCGRYRNFCVGCGNLSADGKFHAVCISIENDCVCCCAVLCCDIVILWCAGKPNVANSGTQHRTKPPTP